MSQRPENSRVEQKYQQLSCPVTGKVSFSSRRAAKRYMRKQSRNGFSAKRAYPCPYCPYVHITSQER